MTGPRDRRPGHRRWIATCGVVACLLLPLALTGGETHATLTSAASAPLTATTATVGTAGSFAAAPNTGFPTCNNEVLTWTAATNATAYKVEWQNNSTTGSWTTLIASTAALTYTDTNASAHLNATVYYRITPLRTPGTWTGTPTTISVQCGIGPILDLTISNQCTSIVLTYTTPYNNTGTNKLEYSTNGGSTWTSLGNIAASTSGAMSYYNRTAPTATKGTTYLWRVTPNSGTGSVSNTSNSITWDNFHVESITNANVTTLGTLSTNDTTTAVFSKPVEPGAYTDTAMSTAAGSMYLANGGTTTNNGLLRFVNGANVFTAKTNIAGTGGWNGARTTYTWTSTGVTTVTQSAALTAGSVTASTAAVCDPNPPELPANPIANVTASAAPTGATLTVGGRW